MAAQTRLQTLFYIIILYIIESLHDFVVYLKTTCPGPGHVILDQSICIAGLWSKTIPVMVVNTSHVIQKQV